MQVTVCIAPDRSFLFLHENICYGYSLEEPLCSTSNEHTQHTVLWRTKKNIGVFSVGKKKKSLIWTYECIQTVTKFIEFIKYHFNTNNCT